MNAAFRSTVIQKKLANMTALLDDLAVMEPVSAAELAADRVTRHALERVLTLLIDSAVDINAHVVAARSGQSPTSYRDSFLSAAKVGLIDDALAAELAPSAGLRNVLIHDYLDVDLDIVAAAAQTARTQFAEYVRQVARSIEP